MEKKFNVRVYGLLLNEQEEVLVTDEIRAGMQMTKFPGGGLEFGEGILDCLKREWKEELGIDLKEVKHFYTTEFFQESVFRKTDQIISIYYLVSVAPNTNIKTNSKAFDFEKKEEGAQIFRWISVGSTKENELTFPIDKIVFEKLKKD